jgi:hypothetical protein
MVEVCILIPVADNSKVLFDDAHHAGFESLLNHLFSGFQMDYGLTSGQWVDAGAVYKDDLRVYRIATKGMIADALKILEMVDFAKAHYAQLVVYVRYLSVSEIV